MSDYDKLLDEIRTCRDELKLKIHLASMDAKDEFEKLEAQWDEFSQKAKLEETAGGVGDALSSLGAELAKGYERLKKAL